jgi:DNA-binding NarL/FixJ family response regulator
VKVRHPLNIEQCTVFVVNFRENLADEGVMRIVVIDSDMAFNTSFTQFCKGLNAVCQVFSQAAAGLAEVRRAPELADVVLIGREMTGGQDGVSVAQSLRKDPQTAGVKFILMSSIWTPADFNKFNKNIGAAGFYSKKTPVQELAAVIERVAGRGMNAAVQKADGTRATAVSGILNVKLLPASEVLNISENIPDHITLQIPINLFSGLGTGAIAAPSALRAASPKVTATKPEVTKGSGSIAKKTPEVIEISFDTPDSEPVSVEAPSKVPVVAVATSPSISKAPAAPTVSVESINIPASDVAYEIEVSKTPVTKKEATKVQTTASTASVSKEPTKVVSGVKVEIPTQAAVTRTSALTPAPKAKSSEEVSMPAIQIAVPQADAETTRSRDIVVKPVSEAEAAKDLPYLFSGMAPATATATASGATRVVQTAPTISPLKGGALSNDVETLKKYLAMREQDVSVLTAQLTYAKDELLKSEDTIKRLSLENEDLFKQLNDVRRQMGQHQQEMRSIARSRDGDLDQLRFEIKSKIDRIKFLEDRIEDSSKQYEHLKERVRVDIRKIRVREKELESKLEILKKDSETLIAARENKILELKRKLDLLEFNYDTLLDQNEAEKQNVVKVKEKLERINKVLKLAGGIIDTETEDTEKIPESPDDSKVA